MSSLFLLVSLALRFRGLRTAIVRSIVKLTTIHVDTRKQRCQVVWNSLQGTIPRFQRFVVNKSSITYLTPEVNKIKLSDTAKAQRYTEPGKVLHLGPFRHVINDIVFPIKPKQTISVKISPHKVLKSSSFIVNKFQFDIFDIRTERALFKTFLLSLRRADFK